MPTQGSCLTEGSVSQLFGNGSSFAMMLLQTSAWLVFWVCVGCSVWLLSVVPTFHGVPRTVDCELFLYSVANKTK
jgi:hypothetical protein